MDDAEIVDSGQVVGWPRGQPTAGWFWATVHNAGPATALDVQLELLCRTEVLETHTQSRAVGPSSDAVYAFLVPVPKVTDQYRFDIVDAEPSAGRHE